MQRFFHGIVLIWTVHASVAASTTSQRSRQEGELLRKLQAFGVVDGPSPTSKPNLPTIFAPIAVPITKPPVAPNSVPIFTRPVSRPARAPTVGFGDGGGESVTIDVAPSTTPTASSSSDSPISPSTTSTPTSAAGVVILDEPTKAPISVVQHVPASWLSFVVTYTSEMYTNVKDPKNIEGILRAAHIDVRKSLSHLIQQQNVTIVIELLQSEFLGM